MSRRLPFFTFPLFILLLLAAGTTTAQTADFSASPVSGCSPLAVQFTDLSTGNITSYAWNLGNSTTSTLRNPSTTYSIPGTYNVSLTVSGSTGTDTKTLNAFITVYDQPTVSFTATTPLAGCTPHHVQLSATATPNAPGNVTYAWDFGDGTTGAGATPAHDYTTAGSYTVSLTVTNGAGCSRTVVQNAYVTAFPVAIAGFSADQTMFCSAPATVNFTNTSVSGTAPFSYVWSFGDGSTGTGSTVSHSYTTGGGFSVRLLVTDARGCTDTPDLPVYITVVDTPVTIAAPPVVCVYSPATFTNTTHTAVYTVWDFGDGVLDSGYTISHAHVYTLAGTYALRMSTIVAGCRKTATWQITVAPKPEGIITMSPSVPCKAPVTVTFSGSAGSTGYTIADYAWSWQSGGTDNGRNVAKIYTANIRDRVTLITTSAAGCKDTTYMDPIYISDIYTNIHPGGDFPVPRNATGCIPLTLDFYVEMQGSLPPPPAPSVIPLPYPLPAISWAWDFGDGSTSTSATPTHTYYNIRDYLVRCITTTQNGCTDTGYRTVHADTTAAPSFIATPTTTCPKSPITFINTSIPLSGTEYVWEVRRSDLKTDTVVTLSDTSRWAHRVKLPDVYTVTLVASHQGCVDTFTWINYIRITPSNADFRDSIFCPPSTSVKFINTSVSPTSQLWDFGDGDTSTAFSPTHAYAATGGYFVRLITYNSTFGCTDTFVKHINLFNPSLDFSVNDSQVCLNQYLRFEGSFSGVGTASYSWRFDNFITPFDSSFYAYLYTHAFATRGFHDVALYVKSGNNCIDSIVKPAYVLAAEPDVRFFATPTSGCQPLNVLFTDTSTNAPGVHTASRTWYFGDRDSAINTGSTVAHTYFPADSYTVRLVVIDSFGCRGSLTRFKYVLVHRPRAAFSATSPLTGCPGDTIRFASASLITPDTASPEHLRHRWDFGDGTTDTGYFPAHPYTAPGNYTVRMIAIDSTGCSDTLTRPAYIHITAPHAAFTPSTHLSICPPLVVSFSNTSTGAVSYAWTFGTGGGPVVPANPTTTFITAGLYNITLVATDINGCTDTARDTVRVLGYNGAFSYTPTEGCAPMTVQFYTSITGIPQILWDFGDGSTATTINSAPTSHTYAAAGGYLPKAIFSSSPTCTSFSAGLDSIKADKLTAGFRWSVPCAGVAFQLYDSSTALYNIPVSWSWSFGGGNSSSGNTTSYSFATPGDHLVTLVATNATGCKDSVTRPVFVNYLPPVKAPEDRGVCPGTIVTLTATGAQSYEWSPASLVSCVACVTTTVQLLSSDTMVITLRGTDGNGCVNTDEVRIYEKLNTNATTKEGGEICIGESFRLFADGGDVYSWHPAATIDSPFIASPLATPTTTTTYIVVAKEGTCNVDTQRVTVVVHPFPPFSAGADQTISLGSAATLHASHSGIDHVVWAKDSTLGCLACFEPNAYPYYTRTYYVTGYSEYGCAATDSVTVHVRCNGSLVYIPNTFSPNGDGLNDYFYPRGEGIERMYVFRVYNRWGELLYEGRNVALNDERAGWDGRYKGQLLTPDVYVYTMEARCVTGELVEFKGDITIMR